MYTYVLRASMIDDESTKMNCSQLPESIESEKNKLSSRVDANDRDDETVLLPDETGPRACLVVVSLFIIGLIESGIIKGFSVLVDELVFQFETEIATIGFIIGLSNGIAYVLAPFTAPLSNRKTIIRPMMMFGSVILGVTISLASLASSVVWFAIAMFTSGVGYALVMLPSLVVCNRYFTKHFGIVLGIIESGSALSLVFPLMTKMMLDATGLRGTILLLGGVSLNMVVCTALLRDPRTLRKNGRREKIIQRVISRANDSDDDGNECSLGILSDSLRFSQDQKEQLTSEHGCPQEDSALLHQKTITHDDHPRNEELMRTRTPRPMHMASPKMISNPANGQASSFQSESQKDNITERTFIAILLTPFRWLWRFLDFSLCRDEPFLNFIYLSTFLFAMVHSGWYIFLVAHALAKGITLSNAVLINLVTGIGEGMGAFFQGPVTDRGWMTSRGLFMVMCLLNSVVLFIDPLLSNHMLLTAAGLVNGFFLGGSLALTSVMLKDTVSEDRFATSYGLSSLTYGLAGPTGGFAAGWIASVVGFEMAFVFLGGLSVAALLAMIPAYYHYDTNLKHRGHQNVDKETPI